MSRSGGPKPCGDFPFAADTARGTTCKKKDIRAYRATRTPLEQLHNPRRFLRVLRILASREQLGRDT